MPEGDSKLDQLNQAVRAYCVIFLVTIYGVAFLFGLWRESPFVSTDAFTGVLGGVIVWWFKGRDEEKTQKAVAEATKVATIAAKVDGGGNNAPTVPSVTLG